MEAEKKKRKAKRRNSFCFLNKGQSLPFTVQTSENCRRK